MNGLYQNYMFIVSCSPCIRYLPSNHNCVDISNNCFTHNCYRAIGWRWLVPKRWR